MDPKVFAIDERNYIILDNIRKKSQVSFAQTLYIVASSRGRRESAEWWSRGAAARRVARSADAIRRATPAMRVRGVYPVSSARACRIRASLCALSASATSTVQIPSTIQRYAAMARFKRTQLNRVAKRTSNLHTRFEGKYWKSMRVTKR